MIGIFNILKKKTYKEQKFLKKVMFGVTRVKSFKKIKSKNKKKV
jgi:hypothetical protein